MTSLFMTCSSIGAWTHRDGYAFTHLVQATFGQAGHGWSLSVRDEWGLELWCEDVCVGVCGFTVGNHAPPLTSMTQQSNHGSDVFSFFLEQSTAVVKEQLIQKHCKFVGLSSSVCLWMSCLSGQCNSFRMSQMGYREEVIVVLCYMDEEKRCRMKKSMKNMFCLHVHICRKHVIICSNWNTILFWASTTLVCLNCRVFFLPFKVLLYCFVGQNFQWL